MSLASFRKKSGLSQQELARRMGIRTSYVRFLEQGNFAKLPKGAYARYFAERYLRVLGLPEAKAKAAARKLITVAPVPRPAWTKRRLASGGLPRSRRLRVPLKRALVAAAILAVLAYLAAHAF